MSKRQSAESQCPDCLAPILWARTSSNGKVALDMKPTPAGDKRGRWILDDLEMRTVKLEGEMLERARTRGRSLFSNHLETCEKRHPQMSLLTEESNAS